MGFCGETVEVWSLIGKILLIFKIVIPILIIIFGMIDLGKAVVASKDDEIKKAVKSLGMRAIAGVFIFFVPTLVGFVIALAAGFGDVQEDYDICEACVAHPLGETCTGKVKEKQ